MVIGISKLRRDNAVDDVRPEDVQSDIVKDAPVAFGCVTSFFAESDAEPPVVTDVHVKAVLVESFTEGSAGRLHIIGHGVARSGRSPPSGFVAGESACLCFAEYGNERYGRFVGV